MKLMAEQETVLLLLEQSLALRQALARSQAENMRTLKQQEDQVAAAQLIFFPLLSEALQSPKGASGAASVVHNCHQNSQCKVKQMTQPGKATGPCLPFSSLLFDPETKCIAKRI